MAGPCHGKQAWSDLAVTWKPDQRKTSDPRAVMLLSGELDSVNALGSDQLAE